MKSWYLENYTPNICGGYESDAISEYAQSNFTDVLYTEFSDDVLLCNYDLSEEKEIKCVIQGNSADTQLKSMERIGLFPIGTVKAGMYIKFEGEYWLITGYPSSNKSYEKAVMQLCQCKLRWQNNDGDIIERYGNITSAAKYDVGENGNSTLFLTSNSFTVLLPCDDETLNITTKRMFIDKNQVKPTKVFKITRSDDVLYDYGGHGCVLSFIADKDEMNTLVDNQELGICDYKESESPDVPPDETVSLWNMKIYCKTDVIKPNNAKVSLTAHLYDENGAEIIKEIEYEWFVVSDIDKYLTYSPSGNKLTISLSDLYDDYDDTVEISCMSKHTGQTDTFTLITREVF